MSKRSDIIESSETPVKASGLVYSEVIGYLRDLRWPGSHMAYKKRTSSASKATHRLGYDDESGSCI